MVRFILSSLRYLGPATFVVAVVALALPACDQGRQGDWCNPELIQDSSAANGINGGAYNEDECNSGLDVPDAADVCDLGLLPDEPTLFRPELRVPCGDSARRLPLLAPVAVAE